MDSMQKMKEAVALPVLVLLAALVIVQGARAHHGQAGLFDQEAIVTLTGTVREWVFVNPHPVLVLDVSGADGATVSWDIYFGPAAVSALGRRGFSDATFAVGETIVVAGHPATAPGALGLDVWGRGVSVSREDGSPVP